MRATGRTLQGCVYTVFRSPTWSCFILIMFRGLFREKSRAAVLSTLHCLMMGNGHTVDRGCILLSIRWKISSEDYGMWSVTWQAKCDYTIKWRSQVVKGRINTASIYLVDELLLHPPTHWIFSWLLSSNLYTDQYIKFIYWYVSTRTCAWSSIHLVYTRRFTTSQSEKVPAVF